MASLVTVRRYYDRSEALVAKSLLDANGLIAIIPDWHYVSMAWHHTIALHGIRLFTIDTQFAEATALLDASSQELPDPGDLYPCDVVFAIVALLGFGIPHPVRRKPNQEL